MKKIKIILSLCLSLFVTKAFAQTGDIDGYSSDTVYQGTLKSYDNPNLRCADSMGAYYVYFDLKNQTQKKYVVLVPDTDITMEMATKNLQLNHNNNVATFTAISIFPKGKIFDVVLDVRAKTLNIFSQNTGKSYVLKCARPKFN